jgi:hypothetical protein
LVKGLMLALHIDMALSDDLTRWIGDWVRERQEDVVFASWVEKIKGARTEDRVLVITQYRVATLKTTLFGSISLQRESCLFDLRQASIQENQFHLIFKDFSILFNCSVSKAEPILKVFE